MPRLITEFVMSKTTNTHSRINTNVEFVCDLKEKMRFVQEGYNRTSPPEDRFHILYLDREIWADMDMPKIIKVSVRTED